MLSQRVEFLDIVRRTDEMTPEQLGKVDAIVIGAGAAGTTAADELCQAGLKVLVLDAGWRRGFMEQPAHTIVSRLLGQPDKHPDFKTLRLRILWKLEQYFKFVDARHQRIQSLNYAWPTAPEKFVDDECFPYEIEPNTQFEWIRCHGPGGRMVVPLHGRQYYRFGPEEFNRSSFEDSRWPISYDDLKPWYDHIEARLGLSGSHDHSEWIPDSLISENLSPTPSEADIIRKIRSHYANVQPIMGRFAPPLPPFEIASQTGKLSFRRGAIVSHIVPNPSRGGHTVKFYDRLTKSHQEVSAPVVFCCASTLETTRILLQSRVEAGEKAPAEAVDPLGGNLMDHVSYVLEGQGGPKEAQGFASDRGRCIYLPRVDLRHGDDSQKTRFGARILRYPMGPMPQKFVVTMEGEMRPNLMSRVRLSERRNTFGIPILKVDFNYGENEEGFLKEFRALSGELIDLFDLSVPNGLRPEINKPGSYVHEMGTARMGNDPSNSVVTPENELWNQPGIYVTDGSCFVTQATQHPTLTIMALTARACAHAVANI